MRQSWKLIAAVALAIVCCGLRVAWSEPTAPAEQTGRQGMVVAVCPMAARSWARRAQAGWQRGRRDGGHRHGPGGHLARGGQYRRRRVHARLSRRGPAAAWWSTIARPRQQQSTADMFAGTQKPSQYKLVGVPGTVAGLALAHARFGKLPWRELVMPAVRLASEGITVDCPLADSLNGALEKRPMTSRSFAACTASPTAQPWQPGDRLLLPELAVTLRKIAELGPVRLLPRDDCRADRRGDAGRRRADHARRPARLSAADPRAGTRHLSRLSRLWSAAAELGRNGAGRDAQHPGKLSDSHARGGTRPRRCT